MKNKTKLEIAIEKRSIARAAEIEAYSQVRSWELALAEADEASIHAADIWSSSRSASDLLSSSMSAMSAMSAWSVVAMAASRAADAAEMADMTERTASDAEVSSMEMTIGIAMPEEMALAKRWLRRWRRANYLPMCMWSWSGRYKLIQSMASMTHEQN